MDVCFGKIDYGPMMYLERIKRLHQRVAYLDACAMNSKRNYHRQIIAVEKQIEYLKGQFQKRQDAYFEKQTSVNQLKRNLQHTGPDNVQMAFVVFRSMEGRARVLNAYK
jgi:hypothetical protein